MKWHLSGGIEEKYYNLSQDIRCVSQGSKRAPPEYESRALSLREPIRSIVNCKMEKDKREWLWIILLDCRI
jgi:hypothetical protein